LSNASPKAAADAPSSKPSGEAKNVKIQQLRSSTTLAEQLRSAAPLFVLRRIFGTGSFYVFPNNNLDA